METQTNYYWSALDAAVPPSKPAGHPREQERKRFDFHKLLEAAHVLSCISEDVPKHHLR